MFNNNSHYMNVNKNHKIHYIYTIRMLKMKRKLTLSNVSKGAEPL